MMQSWHGEGIPSSWQTTGSRAAPLPVPPYERDILPLLLLPAALACEGLPAHTANERSHAADDRIGD